MGVSQFSASVGATATKILGRGVRASVLIQNHSTSKDLKIKIGSTFKGATTQIQTVTFEKTPTSGTWKLSYAGNATAALAFNISSGDLQTALRLVSGLSAVTVSGSVAAGFAITMTSVAHFAGSPELMTVVDNALVIATVESIKFSNTPTAGTWKVKVGAGITSALAYNANAAAVQTAVRLLTGLSAATVTGDYSAGFVVSLIGLSYAAPVEVVESTLTIAAVSQVQKIAFSSVPDAGTWSVSIGGETTSSLAFDANAAAVQAAIRLLDVPLASGATVAGDYTSGFTVTTAGNLGAITVDDSALTDDSAEVTATVTKEADYAAAIPTNVTIEPTTAFQKLAAKVAITTAGNLADAGFVIPEGGSHRFQGVNCSGEIFAQAEDSTAVSFDVVCE